LRDRAVDLDNLWAIFASSSEACYGGD
jgi:hypothetical protein